MAEGRISTPLVLAAASAMVAVGITAWLVASAPGDVARENAARAARPTIDVDDRTPETAAASFYDCWRRRRWPEALSIGSGRAAEAVLAKMADDERLPADERLVAERAWEALAHAPLEFRIERSEDLPQDLLRLTAVAEYSLVGQPYRRRVQMIVGPHAGRYRVQDFMLGEVLTELPQILRGAGDT